MPALPVPTLARERAAWREGRLLVGVDEVGRGPLAGPVVAAAVVFPEGCRRLRGLRDSKLLPAVRRDELAAVIRAVALGFAVGAASVREIDRLNIRVASALAMRRALVRLFARLPAMPAWVLIDGLPLPEIGLEHEALVDGDARCHSIAAAAIIAKTVRDLLMHRLAPRHPGYGWDTNVGYATETHQEGLRLFGATCHHRRSFSPVAQLQLDFT
ncbi:MAG TPA: ribonuclease HII [Gemmatimonadales bacterium]|nr:ribonuclease HII [Gemmatimonadales bacterium]